MEIRSSRLTDPFGNGYGLRPMRVMRRTYRATRGAERELESWAALGVLACVLIVAFAVVLATFVIPAAIGGVVWLGGLLGGSDQTKVKSAHIAGWPWRGLSRAIHGR